MIHRPSILRIALETALQDRAEEIECRARAVYETTGRYETDSIRRQLAFYFLQAEAEQQELLELFHQIYNLIALRSAFERQHSTPNSQFELDVFRMKDRLCLDGTEYSGFIISCEVGEREFNLLRAEFLINENGKKMYVLSKAQRGYRILERYRTFDLLLNELAKNIAADTVQQLLATPKDWAERIGSWDFVD